MNDCRRKQRKRAKNLVDLALKDYTAQQQLNSRSILDAQRDLFERNTEHVQLDAQIDAEVELLESNNDVQIEIIDKSDKEYGQLVDETSISQSIDLSSEILNNKDIQIENIEKDDNENVQSDENMPVSQSIDLSSEILNNKDIQIENIEKDDNENVQSEENMPVSQSIDLSSEGLNNRGTINMCCEGNASIIHCNKEDNDIGDETITAKEDHKIIRKNNVELDNNNVCNTEVTPMISEVTAPSASQNHSRTKLVDYPLETDDEMDDFSAASDDDPCYQPSPETDDYISDLSDHEIQVGNVSNLTRCRKRNTANWKVNVTKRQRAECLPYKNKKKELQAKCPKPVNCTNCRFQCTLHFTEEDRTALCKTYWGFADYGRQKDFIIKYVVVLAPKRRRVQTSSENTRTVSKAYYLENAGGKHRVCANFFEKTLNISNGPINTAIKGAGPTGCFSGSDKRGRKAPGNKTSDVDVSLVKEHIESFPAMESHYVRKDSQKLYLDSGLSILKMYELYRLFCLERNTRPVKECTYRRIFCNNYNFSFFKPKKDLCATCSKYKEASSKKKEEMEANYSLHLLRKTECQDAKAKDKIKAREDPTFLTATFDLQSVLQLPYSDVSLFYYSRKICVYNLTIYLSSGEAHCYTWNELNGKRGSNEIGSILALLIFLRSLPTSVTSISLFCDTCGGQNRNQQVAALLLYAVKEIANLKQIELKFLESGHSQMECDSMHSAIEYAKKHKSAFTMTDWINIFRSARSQRGKNKTKEKYIVHHHKDFFDLQSLASATIKNRNKDADGNTISWLKIKSIKVEKGSPDILFCRYDHSSEYKQVNVSGRGRRRTATSSVLSPVYSNLLPISNAKKADLVKLVNAGHIPEELHPWYRSLPAIELNGPERLPEPDVNESEDEN